MLSVNESMSNAEWNVDLWRYNSESGTHYSEYLENVISTQGLTCHIVKNNGSLRSIFVGYVVSLLPRIRPPTILLDFTWKFK